MTIVLDAGALIAIDRGNRKLLALLKIERLAGRVPLTHGGVVGQVWREGARQAHLARALSGIEILPLDADLGRRSGSLLRRSRTSDVIDAGVVLLASDGDEIFTSDPNDLLVLCEAADRSVELVVV